MTFSSDVFFFSHLYAHKHLRKCVTVNDCVGRGRKRSILTVYNLVRGGNVDLRFVSLSFLLPIPFLYINEINAHERFVCLICVTMNQHMYSLVDVSKKIFEKEANATHSSSLFRIPMRKVVH